MLQFRNAPPRHIKDHTKEMVICIKIFQTMGCKMTRDDFSSGCAIHNHMFCNVKNNLINKLNYLQRSINKIAIDLTYHDYLIDRF